MRGLSCEKKGNSSFDKRVEKRVLCAKTEQPYLGVYFSLFIQDKIRLHIKEEQFSQRRGQTMEDQTRVAGDDNAVKNERKTTTFFFSGEGLLDI